MDDGVFLHHLGHARLTYGRPHPLDELVAPPAGERRQLGIVDEPTERGGRLFPGHRPGGVIRRPSETTPQVKERRVPLHLEGLVAQDQRSGVEGDDQRRRGNAERASLGPAGRRRAGARSAGSGAAASRTISSPASQRW